MVVLFWNLKKEEIPQPKVSLPSTKNQTIPHRIDVIIMLPIFLTKINNLGIEKIKNINLDSFQIAIDIYRNYCDGNDFSSLKCPVCGKSDLEKNTTYFRNFTYYVGNEKRDTVIEITVCMCKNCANVPDRQKYHALLPEFIFPYAIHDASAIINALNDYYSKKKLTEILERLQIRHKLFYDWINKINKYCLHASTVLGIDNKIEEVISKIVETNSVFLSNFYYNFNHPFFLFKLTCVPLCIG